MNFFAGLEKFGFSGKEDLDITKDERKVAHTAGGEKKAVVELEEKDLILEKTMECPVCHRNFVTKQVKTGKAKAVRFSTLEAICKALDCQPGDILEYRED